MTKSQKISTATSNKLFTFNFEAFQCLRLITKIFHKQQSRENVFNTDTHKEIPAP